MKFRLKWFQSQFPLPPNYSKETKEIENQPTVGWDHFNLNFVFTYNIYPASVQATTCTNWRKNNTVGRDSKPGSKAGNPEQGYQRTQWRVSTVYLVAEKGKIKTVSAHTLDKLCTSSGVLKWRDKFVEQGEPLAFTTC